MKKKYIFSSMTFIIIAIFMICSINVKANIGGMEQDLEGNLTVITAGQVGNQYVEKFNKIYPNVRVQLKTLSDYESQIKDMIDTGDYGDVLLLPNAVSYDEWEKYFEVLGNYNELSRQYLFMDTKRKEERVYGIPMCGNAQGILYNKKIFDEAGIKKSPTTIEEFITCLRMVKTHTEAIPFYTNYNTTWALTNWQSYPFGAMTGDKDYRYNRFVNEKKPFNEGKNYYRVYKLLYDIANQGFCEDDMTQDDWWQSICLLNEGKIGSMAIGSWVIPQAQGAGAYPENIGYMPFPNSIEGKQYMTIAADYAYAISSNSKNKAAARAWIDFMIQDSGYARDKGAISIVKADPLPMWLNDFKNVEFIIDNYARDNNGYVLGLLEDALQLQTGQLERRVIDAATGKSQETFDDIMKNCNEIWENARPVGSNTVEEMEGFTEGGILQNSYEIFFSINEKEYLKQNKEIKVGYIENLSPLQYQKDGMFFGIAADIFEFIREKSNLNFVYEPFDTFSSVIMALRLGKIDAIAGMEKIGEYEDELTYSKDYLEYLNVIIKQNTVDTSSLNNKSMGVLEGTFKNYDFNLDSDAIRYYSTAEQCLEAVEDKKVDFTVSNYYTVNECFREKNYNNLVIQPLMKESKYSIVFKNDVDVRLMSIINKVIYSLSSEQKQVIILKNTQGTYTPPTLVDLIQAYPIASILCVIIIACMIIGVLYYFMYLQVSHNKVLAINAKKYEQLADIAGEYIFEYDYQKDDIILSEKLKKRRSLNEEKKYLEDYNEHVDLYQFVKNIKNKQKDDFEQVHVKLALHNEIQEWYQVIYSTVYDEYKNPLFLIGKLINIQKQVEERTLLEQQAEKDQLTGIYNRGGFYKMLGESREKQLEKGISALCIIDLDEFKNVNDTLGHGGGDEVLVMLSRNLQEVFKEDAIISRFGGDEFVVYVERIDSVETLNSKARELCSRMDTAIQYNNNNCRISISMGIAVDSRNISYEDLLDRADKELYKSKENGRNQYNICV